MSRSIPIISSVKEYNIEKKAKDSSKKEHIVQAAKFILNQSRDLEKYAGKVKNYTWLQKLTGLPRQLTKEERNNYKSDIRESNDYDSPSFLSRPARLQFVEEHYAKLQAPYTYDLRLNCNLEQLDPNTFKVDLLFSNNEVHPIHMLYAYEHSKPKVKHAKFTMTFKVEGTSTITNLRLEDGYKQHDIVVNQHVGALSPSWFVNHLTRYLNAPWVKAEPNAYETLIKDGLIKVGEFVSNRVNHAVAKGRTPEKIQPELDTAGFDVPGYFD